VSDEEFKLKLGQDLGFMKGVLKGLDGKVDGLGRKVESLEGAVNSKISSIHQSIAGLVRREDCQTHMGAVRGELSEALTAAAQAQAVAQAAVAKADEAEEQTEAIREVTARHAVPKPPSLWSRMVEHSRGLTSILVVLGMLLVGFLALVHFVNKVERSLALSEEMNKRAQESMMKRLLEPRGAAPDAGVEPRRPKKR